MAERDDGVLERDLHGLGAAVEWPEADVAASVGAELRAGRHSERPVPRLALWPRRRVVGLIVVGLLLIAGTAFATKLAIGAISIETVPELTSPSASTPSGSPSVSASPDASLGNRVSLSEARAEVGFPITLPRLEGLGAPSAVFVGDFSGSTRVSLAWAPDITTVLPGAEKGLLLMEFPGEDPGAATKEVLAETRIHPVRVGDGTGYWIEGPHQLLLADGSTIRATGSVLLWRNDGITFRLESKLSEADAVRLANSVA
jgi:hypothetical protein